MGGSEPEKIILREPEWVLHSNGPALPLSDCKSCRALEKHFDHLHFMCKEVNYNDGEDSHWHDNLIRKEL